MSRLSRGLHSHLFDALVESRTTESKKGSIDEITKKINIYRDKLMKLNPDEIEDKIFLR